jgi:glutamate-1-semialdehyde 2,1-aminomutase
MDPFDASRRPVSAAWFARGDRVIPGGVNSPVRSFRAVGGTPVLAASGRGSRIRTADGVELTDYCGSWGPLILGHAHPEVVAAVGAAAADGLTFGLHTGRGGVLRIDLRAGPSIEKVRLVTPTEAW